jgi:phosphoglycolate phosphatase
VIRNIIFDWSGTLVDDLPSVLSATNHVLQQAGLKHISLDQFRSEFCLPFTKFYERYTPHIPMPTLEEWFHGHFKTVQDNVVELPHARDFLEFCRKHEIRTFLLSTVHRDHYDVQARTTGFGDFIETSGQK